MTIDDKIRDAILQYDFNRATPKISALLSGKIDKQKYLTGEEILPPQKHRIIQEAKFTYSPIGKEFEEQTKTVEKHDEKQIRVIEPLESPDKESLSIKKITEKVVNAEIAKDLENIWEQKKTD